MEIKLGDIISGRIRVISGYVTLVGKVVAITRHADIIEEYQDGKFVEVKRNPKKVHYIVNVLFDHPQNEYTLTYEYNLTESEIRRYDRYLHTGKDYGTYS